MRRRVLAPLALLLVAGGVGGVVWASAEPAPRGKAPPARARPAVRTTAPPRGVLVARARGAVVPVWSRAAGGRPVLRLRGPVLLGRRYPLVFLVREGGEGRVRVALPVRPNEVTGWVRTQDVSLSLDLYRVDIDLRRHRLRAWRLDRLVTDTRIVGGAPETPTPRGAFYITEKVRAPDPSGPYGAWALGLSAHSSKLTEFAGGDGQAAVHGTSSPSQLGTDVSNGCVRVRNDVIARLARRLPLGTPVVIR